MDANEIVPGLWVGAALPHPPPGVDGVVNLCGGGEDGFGFPGGPWVRFLSAPILKSEEQFHP